MTSTTRTGVTQRFGPAYAAAAEETVRLIGALHPALATMFEDDQSLGAVGVGRETATASTTGHHSSVPCFALELDMHAHLNEAMSAFDAYSDCLEANGFDASVCEQYRLQAEAALEDRQDASRETGSKRCFCELNPTDSSCISIV